MQDAVAAKEGAEAAKQSAETAQKAAAENQKNAGTHAENAKASADTAAEQAAAAKGSATGAANSASAAQKFETNAGLSATAAANAEAAAKQAQQAAETAKADAETAKTAAGTSADAAAASAADAKKTLESIPDDYSTLSGKVDDNTSGIRELKVDTATLQKRQNVLVGSETGNPIAVDDAFAAPLCGLTVYGKSTQDGTPTPDNPVPIQSAGQNGTVDVTVCGANIFDAANAVAYRNIQRTSISDVCTISEKSQIVLTRTGYLAWLSQNFAPGTYTITFLANKKFYSIQTNSVESVSAINDYDARIVPGEVFSVTITESVPFFISIRPGAFEPPLEIYDFMVCPGKTAPNAFVPYVTPQQLPIPTPNGLPGIPVTSGGNYTDQNGQQWVCDEVDLERGVKVQRVGKCQVNTNDGIVDEQYRLRVSFLGDKGKNGDDPCIISITPYSSWTSCVFQNLLYLKDTTKPEGSFYTGEELKALAIDVDFVYQLATSIETPLAPAEIAAYKAITAYAPDTVVQASDGAGVKLEYQRDVNIVIKKFEDAIASMTTT